jgi:hypothetical protein
LVAAFLSIHRELTETIHGLCAAKGFDALKNHAADALECLISTEPGSLAPLDHLLGLRIQNHLALFGPMTFVRAVAAEFDVEFVVEEYSRGVPIQGQQSRANSLAK